ncbi:MAG: hypothetical protein EXR77_11905 [Myxococcales bacterium]|nr:hypothetical protein [Myxococcales bacterium]
MAADQPEAADQLGRLATDPDSNIYLWTLQELARQEKITPRYLAGVAGLTGFDNPPDFWPNWHVLRIGTLDEAGRALLVADRIAVLRFGDLVRVAGSSRNAQGLVDLCAAIVAARAPELDGDALANAATLPGARQYEVELDDSKGYHLPDVIEKPLPALDLRRLGELAAAELARRA